MHIDLKWFSCISVDEESSLKKSELINWYLKEIESEIESEAELISRKNLIEKVLHRLVHYVSVDLINKLPPCLKSWSPY